MSGTRCSISRSFGLQRLLSPALCWPPSASYSGLFAAQVLQIRLGGYLWGRPHVKRADQNSFHGSLLCASAPFRHKKQRMTQPFPCFLNVFVNRVIRGDYMFADLER